MAKAMVIDGIAASEAIDSSGEILSVAGLDISDLEAGLGVLNYEHRSEKDGGASSNDIIGAITYAKKIFKPEDCENPRQRMYWDKIELPFVYITAELFNGEDHTGAKAAASLIRYYHRRHLPILMRFSIEGSTIEREGNFLKRSVARRVAATLKPCNRSCISGVLEDADDVSSLDELVRGDLPTTQIKKSVVYEFDALVKDEAELLADKLENFKEIKYLNELLMKYNVAPTQLNGYSALQTEWVDGKSKKKKKLIDTYKKWARKEPLEKFINQEHPDVPADLVKYFLDGIESYHNGQTELLYAALHQLKPKSVLIKNLGDLLAKFNQLVKTVGPTETTPKIQTDKHGLQELSKPDAAVPGKIKVHTGPYAGSVLHYHGPDDRDGHVCSKDPDSHKFIIDEDHKVEILEHPIKPVLRHQVHGIEHAVFDNNTPEQTNLIHGLILNPDHREYQQDRSFSSGGLIFDRLGQMVDPGKSINGKHINPLTGKAVFIKSDWISDWTDPIMDDLNRVAATLPIPKAEQIHHDAAHHFWGTGALYPTLTAFKHPDHNYVSKHFAASEFVPGEELFSAERTPEFQNWRWKPENDELLKRHMVSEMIMGNTDRHAGNMIWDKDSQKLHMIDNGFMNEHALSTPYFLQLSEMDHGLPQSIRQWLHQLDFSKLDKLLQDRQLPDHLRRQVMHHALNVQSKAMQPVPLLWRDLVNPRFDPGVAQPTKESTPDDRPFKRRR
jgi:hypothetical protein